jgi:hypothetical protein
MAQLSEPIKTFIVQRLAMFDTPTEVADAVKEEFGVEVDRRQVQTYDPERTGEKPAEKWAQLHAATRTAFLEESAKVPIAERAVRLRELQKLFTRARGMGNLVLAADLLERAAKETGNAYTNRRELTGAGGGPIETKDRSLEDLTAEELMERARALAAGVSAGAAP